MIYEEQPGLTVTRENNKLHAKVDPDKFGRQKMNLQSQNEEKIRVLQAEIERLAVLLKEEQKSHELTRSKAQNDLEALEERLHSENNSKLQKLREEFQEAQAEQIGEFNRKQAVAADDAIRLTRQLEDELADNTVAFEHFQAQSRRQFEEEFSTKLKTVLDEESEKRIALEEKFQKRVRNRLKEQRLEIESENEENLAKILQAHKNEIEALSGKIAANKNAKSMLEDTEAKVTGLSAKIEQLQQKLVLAEKNYAEKSADCRRLNQKVADIESGHKRQLEQMMMNQNSEKSRLLEEIAQLRNRLIKKAETLGEYEFNATNRPNLPSTATSVGGESLGWRKGKLSGQLEDILRINQT